MTARAPLGLTAVFAVLALAACGGSSGGSSSTASTPSSSASTSSTAPASSTSSAAAGGGTAATSSHLSLAADPGGALKFDQSTLHAAAGRVTIAFANHSPVPHNLTISGPGGQVVTATPTFQGAKKTVSATLKPGTYTFSCTVPGHRQAGMQGTLTVS